MNIQVAEVQVDQYVHQLRGRETALVEHGKIVFHEGLEPLDIGHRTTHWNEYLVDGRTGGRPSSVCGGGDPAADSSSGFTFAIADCMNTRPLDFPWYRNGCEPPMDSFCMPSARSSFPVDSPSSSSLRGPLSAVLGVASPTVVGGVIGAVTK